MAARAIAAGALLSMLALAGVAQAQMDAPSLKSAPPNVTVTSVRYCKAKAEFRLTLGDGTARAWPEFSVMLKLDGTEQGPAGGKAVWLPARGPGDRILVIFASIDDLKQMVQPGC